MQMVIDISLANSVHYDSVLVQMLAKKIQLLDESGLTKDLSG